MADDEALRARRSRAHRSGDHQLCRPGSCSALRRPPDGLAGDDDVPVTVAAAVADWGATLEYGPGDVRGPMLTVAMLVARALDAGRGSPAPLVRALRQVLADIVDVQLPPGDAVDQLRLRRSQRIAEMLTASGGVWREDQL